MSSETLPSQPKLSTPTSSRVAIITPIYRTHLSDQEHYAIRHILYHLSNYSKFIIAPDRLQITITGFETIYFSAHYFAGIAGYNQLMLSPSFYQTFATFEYILICQLDALILSDRLQTFCDLGYDYIGSPWFASSEDPNRGFIGCGNGGLSLRHVQHCLDVLESDEFDKLPLYKKLWRVMTYPYGDMLSEAFHMRLLKKLNIFRQSHRGLDHYIHTYKWNEDRFWGLRVPMFYPSFKIAPIEIGLDFAFEMFPDWSLQHNHHQLPFGCHAWWRYGADFWRPYLIDQVDFIFDAHERD